MKDKEVFAEIKLNNPELIEQGEKEVWIIKERLTNRYVVALRKGEEHLLGFQDIDNAFKFIAEHELDAEPILAKKGTRQ